LNVPTTITNTQGYDGGVFHLDNPVSVTLHQTAITNSKAFNNGGVFYMSGTSDQVLTLDTLVIATSEAVLNGGVIYSDNLN